MTPAPTGRIETTDDGRVLAFDREFAASIDDVWASVTETERTARWIGSWAGDPASGTVDITWLAEEGSPTEPARIVECTAPVRLSLILNPDDAAPWHVTIDLRHDAGTTTLTFRQRLGVGVTASTVGSGWDFYLDRLVAVRAGEDPKPFDGYPEGTEAHYRALD